MKALNVSEKCILSLVFGYQAYDIALRAMDSYGDEESAQLVTSLRNACESCGKVPDLSHENLYGHVQLFPTRDDFVVASSKLIDAFDVARESSDRTQKLQLRRTIEAIFELRACARHTPVLRDQSAPQGIRDAMLNRELSTYPLSSNQVNKLRMGGYVRLRDLYGEKMVNIVGKCGLTEKQVENLDNLIGNYLKAVVSVNEIGFRNQLEVVGKTVIGEGFKLMDGTSAFWFNEFSNFAGKVQPKETLRTTRKKTLYPRLRLSLVSEIFGWEGWLDSLDQQPATVFIQFKKWLKLVSEWMASPTEFKAPTTPSFASNTEWFETLVQSPKPPFFKQKLSKRKSDNDL
jgi:hypothetical protein